MASSDNEVRMMMSVYPGAMTGFAAMNAGLSSILNVFNAMTRAFDQQFGLVDAALTTTSVVVTQLGVDAMNAFGQFEQGMKIVQMVSGQTASDMDYLKQKANEFSVEYRTDIDQITEGLQTLGRAGLNTASEQAEVLENGLTTAKLEGRELNSVLQELIQNTALVGGNLKSSEFGEDSQYLNDLLVATSMTAPITTHDISETLKYSGGIAAAAGAKIRTDTGEVNEEGKRILEDYMGTIAAFAQKGVSGSIAGTALRAFLNKPATQDSSVTDALASIHLKPEYLWEEGEETMKPISEQIGLIQDQMDKLNVSTMDRLQIWSKIVGGKMGQQMMKLDSDDIKEITKDIQAADSASNLAANSMKTYQANVKAAGESGALIQRNVGEKLVSIVNPWLELTNKILEFLSQDFMSMPLTAGVIAFVGYLFAQIRRVASTVRSEISNLLALTKEAQAFMHQSMTGRAQMDKDQVGSFVSMQPSTQKRGTKSWSERAASEAGSESAESFKSYWQAYSKGITESGALSFSELKKSGIAGDRLAAISRLQTLKSMDEFGIKDQDYVAAGLRYGHLTQEQEAKLITGAQQGMTPRNLFNSVFGDRDSAAFQKLKNDLWADTEAAKALGFAIDNEARARSAMLATFGPNAKGTFGGKSQGIPENFYANQVTKFNTQMNEAMMKTFGSKTGVGVAEDTYANQISKAINQGAIKSKEVVNFGGEQVVVEFNEMMAAISQSVLNNTSSVKKIIPPTMYPNRMTMVDLANMRVPAFVSGESALYTPKTTDTDNRVTSSHVVVPNELLNQRPVSQKAVEEYERALRAKDLEKKDTEMRARQAEQAYNNPYIADKTGRTKTDARIDAALRGKRLENDIKEYDEAMNQHLKKLTQTHLNANKVYSGAVGVGNIPGIEENLRREKEAREEHVKNLGNQASAGKKVLDQINSQSKESGARTKLSTVQYGVEELALEEERLQIVREELLLERQRADSQKVYTSRGSASKESSGMGKFGMGRSDVRQMSDAARQDATTKAIQRGMESNSLSSRLLDRVNTIAKQNQGQSSSYMSGIRQNQENLKATLTQFNKQQEALGQLKNLKQDLTKGVISQSVYRTNVGDITAAGGRYTLLSPNDYMASAINISNQMNSMKNDLINGVQKTTSYPSGATVIGGRYSLVDLDALKNKSTLVGGFRDSIKDRWNANRAGRLNFGTYQTAQGLKSVTSGLRGMGNGLLNMVDVIGGPVMLAFMAIPALINMWKGWFDEFCTSLKDATDQVKNAYSERQSAEEGLKQLYKEQNPDAEKEDIEQFVLDSYSQLYKDRHDNPEEWMKKTSQYLTDSSKYKQYEYDQEKDDGTYKEKEKEEDSYEEALRKNTSALYSATAQLDIAMNKLTSVMQDSWWGIDGWTGQLTDLLGYAQDHMFKNNGQGSNFTEEGSFLLTASQKDENYSGSKELAGLMLEDFHDARGDWQKGLQTLYGTDSKFLTDVMNESARTFLSDSKKGMANFASRLTPTSRNRIQASMMNDKKTWQGLAKEIFKYESKNKKSVGAQETTNKRLEGLIKKLQIDTRLNRMQIIQAAYLQEMQDMYQVMEQVFTPMMAEQSTILAQNLLGTEDISGSSAGVKGNTYGTEAIASVISANVAVIAKSKAAEAVYNEALSLGPNTGDADQTHLYELAKDSPDANAFYKKAMDEAYGTGLFSSIGWVGDRALSSFGSVGAQAAGAKFDKQFGTYYGGNDYAAKQIAVVYRALAQVMNNPNLSISDAIDLSKGVVMNNNGKIEDIFTNIGKMYSTPAIIDQVKAAYGASGVGEPDGSGSGSGGSGSGSGNKDKDQGTKKERVDLVLCNKKEIPKLNVNLFKKAPSFTILNKNFKLRDIKVNTQDKPKAVLASIKNAIIDVQKRTDPKIIQDEEAIYDPVGATDGNTPSGTSDVRTNTG